jgi:hypothetical protein
MGAWGYSALESDEGQEIKERWQSLVDLGYDSKKIISTFLQGWGDSINYGDSIINNEIIAASFLCIEKEVVMPEKLKKAACDAINRELDPSELECWDNSENRAVFLTSFLDRLGGRRKVPRKYKFFSDPVLEYRSSIVAQKELIKAMKKMQASKVPLSFSQAGFPRFFSTLERFVSYGITEKDTGVYIEAKKQKLMMLATYLLLNINSSEDDLEKFLNQVERGFN